MLKIGDIVKSNYNDNSNLTWTIIKTYKAVVWLKCNSNKKKIYKGIPKRFLYKIGDQFQLGFL